MTKKSTMARAAADLAAGDIGMARRRLASLRRSLPTDLDVRRALRDACRAGGDRAEAGRWGFVLDGTTDAEVVAFRRSRGDHVVELARAVCWDLRDDVPSEAAACRLADLRAQLADLPAATRRQLDPSQPIPETPGDRVLDAVMIVGFVVGFVVVPCVLMGLGAYQAVELLRGVFG